MLSIAEVKRANDASTSLAAWPRPGRQPSLAVVPPADAEVQYRRRLGAALVQLRAIDNMSQATFAERVERSEAAVSRWETGKVTPSAYDLRRIAEIFSIPMSSLDLLIFPPSGPVSPVAERLAAAVEAGGRTGRANGGRRRAGDSGG